MHVSIVNWIKAAPGIIDLSKGKLWYRIEKRHSRKAIREKRGNIDVELDFRLCDNISAALSDSTDVTKAPRLLCNAEPQRVFQGQVPGHEAFVLEPSEAAELIQDDPRNRAVIWPFLIGRDLVTGNGEPTRFVIDFQPRTVIEARAFRAPFRRIEELVLPDREKKAQKNSTADGKKRPHHQLFLRYWWNHSYGRPDMVASLAELPRFIVCSDTTKRPIFEFVANSIRPDHKVRVFAFADDFSFGILQSHAHWLWFITKCSKLGEQFNYTSDSVFETFPWPQSPTKAQTDAVAEAGREVRRVRGEALKVIDGGLRAVYRTLELPGKHPLKDAHAALDAAVLAAYGFSVKKDLLQQLLDLNHAVAAKEKAGEPVTAPGVPTSYGDPAQLITEDCIKPRDEARDEA